MIEKEKLENIKPIKDELRPLLEEFLAYEPYQNLFMAFAKNMGYPGEDMLEAKQGLFTIDVKSGEIGFNVEGMKDLFLEYQILRQVITVEPYRSLLTAYPQAMIKLREFSKKILNKEEVTQKELLDIFNPELYGSKEKE